MDVRSRIAAILCCLLTAACCLAANPAQALAEDAASVPNAGAVEETPASPAEEGGADTEQVEPSAPVLVQSDGNTQKTPVNKYMFMSKDLLLLPVGGDIESAVARDNLAVQYGVRSWMDTLDASWDFDAFDTSRAGWQMLTGNIILPEGYAYYVDGVETPLVAEQQVWVYAEGMEEAGELYLGQTPTDEGVPTLTLPVGSSSEDVQALLEQYCTRAQVLFSTAEGFSLRCAYSWDTGLVDTSRAGIYYPYIIDTPPGIVPSEAWAKRSETAVVVVEGDKVDLSGMFHSFMRGAIFEGRWLYEAENPQLWMTQTSPLGEDAQPVWHAFEGDGRDQEFCADDLDISATVCSDSLLLDFREAPDGDYYFQIRYEGGESNYYQVTVDGDTASGKMPTVGDRIGDTDGNRNPPAEEEPEPLKPESPTPKQPNGGSTGTQNSPTNIPTGGETSDPPDGSTPTPADSDTANTAQGIAALNTEKIPNTQNTTGEATAKALPQETTDPASVDGVVFTGAQLRALMAVKPEYVPFVRGDVEVWIPTGALEALGFADEDVFAVRAEYVPGQRLTVLITLNGQGVILSEAFLAGIPWDGGAAEWQDAEGAAVPAEYDNESGRLLLTFVQPGTVYLVAGAATEEIDNDRPAAVAAVHSPPTDPPVVYPYVAMVIVLTGCAGGGIAFAYLRKRRQSH